MSFKVMSRRCDQCLMDPENRIVSSRRAAGLLRTCAQADIPFLCHKGSIAGQDIACRGHHDASPCRVARMGEWLGIAPVEIDPDTLQRVQQVAA